MKISLIASIGMTCIVGCKQVVPENSNILSASEVRSIKDLMNMSIEESLYEFAESQDDPSYKQRVSSLPREYGSSQMALTSKGRVESLSFVSGLSDQIKKAWEAAGRSSCAILKPYFGNGKYQANKKPYFFIGSSVNGGAVVKGVAGKDFVWDLYNMQFSAFSYSGFEATAGAGAIGAGVNGYVGAAMANSLSVKDAWIGQFMSAGISGNIFPVLADYLSLGGTGFSSTTNSKPDFKVTGVTLGVQLGFSVPTASPVGVTAQAATWEPDPKANRVIADIWRRFGVPLATDGKDTCGGNCVRLDSLPGKPASYRGRALSLLASVPLVALPAGGGTLVGFPSIALLALATGTYRDVANAAQACGFK